MTDLIILHLPEDISAPPAGLRRQWRSPSSSFCLTI